MSLSLIAKDVQAWCKVTGADVTVIVAAGKAKTLELSRMRWGCWWVLFHHHGWPLESISTAFGADHTSVQRGMKEVTALINRYMDEFSLRDFHVLQRIGVARHLLEGERCKGGHNARTRNMGVDVADVQSRKRVAVAG